jgi:quercetin dioxygenase-like cupin family protein
VQFYGQFIRCSNGLVRDEQLVWHPGEEAVYVLEGEVVVELEESAGTSDFGETVEHPYPGSRGGAPVNGEIRVETPATRSVTEQLRAGDFIYLHSDYGHRFAAATEEALVFRLLFTSDAERPPRSS